MSEIDILSFGETMAMFVAEQAGDLSSVNAFHKRIAGADSNVAIGLSRLGFKVAWLSRVGADSLGRFVIDTLEKEGLDCHHVDIDAAHPTGFQLKSRTDDGSDPAVEYFRRGSAASHLSPHSIVPQIAQGPTPARHRHPAGAVANRTADVVRIDDPHARGRAQRVLRPEPAPKPVGQRATDDQRDQSPCCPRPLGAAGAE